jgi:hypothetical protein
MDVVLGDKEKWTNLLRAAVICGCSFHGFWLLRPVSLVPVGPARRLVQCPAIAVGSSLVRFPRLFSLMSIAR